MTYGEFHALVAAMRDEQKKWFGGDKSQVRLEECKRLEKSVDRAIASFGQEALFDETVD